MRKLLLISVVLLLSEALFAQNLDKVQIMCIDEVSLPLYEGKLTKKQLEEQTASFGFRYVENGEIKYHKDLIIYDCNSGEVKLTAEFDKNHLVKEFRIYDKQSRVQKKFFLNKDRTSSFVDLKFTDRTNVFAVNPEGTAKFFTSGKLVRKIDFSSGDGRPYVTNFNQNGQRIATGPAYVKGQIDENLVITEIGEWSFFEDEQIQSKISYDQNGQKSAVSFYKDGKVSRKMTILTDQEAEFEFYYADGSLKKTGKQIEELKTGTWKYYDRKGNLEKEEKYNNDSIRATIAFTEAGNIKEEVKRITNKSDLPKSMVDLEGIFEFKSYYSNQSIKKEGYLYKNNKLGTYKSYKENGSLKNLVQYDSEGKKVRTINARAYQKIKESQYQISLQLLVAETTNPLNLKAIDNIESLSSSLNIDFDSLMEDYQSQQEFEVTYDQIKSQIAEFGDLAKEPSWYDTLLTSTTEFNEKVWSYAHELIDTELFLEKELAKKKVKQFVTNATEEFTTTKKTLFGEKLIVLNNQDKIYETIVEEILPSANQEIEKSLDKEQVRKTLQDFDRLLEKASMVISQPNREFEKSLENLRSLEDKKELFLSVK